MSDDLLSFPAEDVKLWESAGLVHAVYEFTELGKQVIHEYAERVIFEADHNGIQELYA